MTEIRTAFLLMTLCTLSASHSIAEELIPVELSSWQSESYPDVQPGDWQVDGSGLKVKQVWNGKSTFFYSDFTSYHTQLVGKITVDQAAWDNDFIGFAFGFDPGDATSPTADYLVVDWKAQTQFKDYTPPYDCGPGTTASQGLAVSRVRGIPQPEEFWDHIDQDLPCTPLGWGVEELARGMTRGNVGWDHGVTYTFKFEFDATYLKVWVDDVLEIDITGAFEDGRFCLYNFSMADVNYEIFRGCPGECLSGLCGDCNGDQFVNVADALMAVKRAVGLTAPLPPVDFEACNVHGNWTPDRDAEITVLDGLWIAQHVVGLRLLDCCNGKIVSTPIDCGEFYCNTFTEGTMLPDLGNPVTTHWYELPVAPPNTTYRITLSGSGDIDLYVANPGVPRGDPSGGNYPFKIRGPGAVKELVIDETTMPKASDYHGGNLALAVSAVSAGGYTIVIDCFCNPPDITFASQPFFGSTIGALQKTQSVSCGGDDYGEVAYIWDVQRVGSDLVISTDNPGTDFDTVLYVSKDGCDAGFNELDCDDDSGTGTTSILTISNAQLGKHYIMVDGKTEGNFELTIEERAATICTRTIDANLTGMPLPITYNGDTNLADNSVYSFCATSGGPDDILEFVAPMTGPYTISTCGANFDHILGVREDNCLMGAWVACADNNTCANGAESVSLNLSAGRTYWIVVEGNNYTRGLYTLNISSP